MQASPKGKRTMEDTAHTAQHSAKVSLLNYPIAAHSASQTKIRVFSNPKIINSNNEAGSKAIDWMKAKVGLEDSPTKAGKGQT